ncbi:MAG: hypothetical protein VB031_09525 [Eubacteriaceae bacterium]|nr:hypothetical protein [Eubacteriaceae bacterium]
MDNNFDDIKMIGRALEEWDRLPLEYRRGGPNEKFREFGTCVNELEEIINADDPDVRGKLSIEYVDRSGCIMIRNYTHQISGPAMRKFCDILSKFDMACIDSDLEYTTIELKMNCIFDEPEWVEQTKATLTENSEQ